MTIERITDLARLRAVVAAWRREGASIGFVPTMGALHEGHLSLVDEALKTADRAVVSIFVNPTQFAPHEDFDSYPRQYDEDAKLLEARGADLIYMPERAQMYPEGFATAVKVAGVSEDLEGAFRPHFFEGVATVVAKLLIRVLPDVAVFGEKDYQQLKVVQRMSADLDLPVRIAGAPIVREADGLAMSSRNAYLSAAERKVAATLNVALDGVANAVAGGADIHAETTQASRMLLDEGFDSVDYLEVRDAETLKPFDGPPAGTAGRSARVLAAATIGRTRLIDNRPVPSGGAR